MYQGTEWQFRRRDGGWNKKMLRRDEMERERKRVCDTDCKRKR